MKNRLIANILIAFIFIPLIVIIRDYIQIDIMHDPSKYHGTFLTYFGFRYWYYFVLSPLAFAILVLLPYNIAILKLGKNKPLTLGSKILIFQMIFTVMFVCLGTLGGLTGLPFWIIISYIMYLIPISILFATLIHLLVDKKLASNM